MPKVIAVQFQDQQVTRLERVARRLGRSASETSALLVEEGLRRTEFEHIDFRDSAAGRQAYVVGTRVTVWQVIMVALPLNMDAEATAGHLEWPIFKVESAFHYASAFPDEIETALLDNDAMDEAALKLLLPNLIVVEV